MKLKLGEQVSLGE